MNRSKLIQLLLLAFTLAGCVQRDLVFPGVAEGANPDAILFRADTRDDFATKGAGYNTNAPYTINSMGIFASYTVNSWDESDPINFMTDQKVERSNVSESWGYQPQELWPSIGFLSFFAYAPHQDNWVYGSNRPVVSGANGMPRIDYTIAPSHDQQVDFMIATPLMDQTKRDLLTIPLRHALTKIAFSARLVNEPSVGVTYKVTQIQLNNLRNSGSIKMDGANRNWVTTTSTATYIQSIGNNGLKELDLATTYQSITPIDGHLFLLPQQLADDSSITFTYEVTTNGVTATYTKTLLLNLAISRWNPGDAYNLMFAIDNGVSFIVVPTPWDDTVVKADIKNRILNVTRIEANVYPGVSTRIYFWCNQPKDSLYVRENGNMDANKYPTGIPYKVDDFFQSLSNKGASNLNYKGFDGVQTSSGEGFIDVVHKDDLFKDGDRRHIWLNASGMARNILLNTIDRGNRSTLPYVGTFHRWNELGERIITWGYSGNWTAEVSDHLEGTAILLDREPSPYMATGQLYGSGDVGDPEAAKLNASSTSKVSGSGRVYFRVGIKDRLSNKASSPRYGRIVVEGANVGGSGIDKVFLYVRQGESDDFLFMNSADDRPAGVKWSPFNLTVGGLSSGGSVQVDPARSNSSFVKYPTQAGAIFKWTEANLSIRPMVYAPIGTLLSWSTPTYTGFWSSIMSMQESCPPGYRRPNRGSIHASVESGVAVDAEVVQSLFKTPNYNQDGNHSQSVWGYYADGFFDRRSITNATGVSAGEAVAVESALSTVGYVGRLFYSDLYQNSSVHSLFFPAAGIRNSTSIESAGVKGSYWSASAKLDVGAKGWYLHTDSNVATTKTGDLQGMSIRCVRDLGFSTELPDYEETIVPTALGYIASSGVVDGAFISQWNATILNDIASLALGAHRVRAKVTFNGTLSAGVQTVFASSLLGSTRIASGSTIVYDFSQAGLSWSAGTVIEVEVENSKWEYSTDGGSTYVSGGINVLASLTSKGVIILKKK